MFADESELGAQSARLLEMEADDLVFAVRICAKPACQALVQICSQLLRQAVVRRVLNECMLEPERILNRGGRRIRLRQLPADERRQMLSESVAFRFGEKHGDRAPPKTSTFYGGPLQDRALGRVQAGDTSSEHGLDSRRQRRGFTTFLVGSDKLLEEQRVALGCPDDSCDLRRLQPVGDEGLNELLCIRLGESLQRDHGSVRIVGSPRRARLEKLWPGKAEHEERRTCREADEILDQVEEKGLGPVDIVEADNQYALRGRALQELPHRPEGLLQRRRFV